MVKLLLENVLSGADYVKVVRSKGQTSTLALGG
jgi:hypothetical protein